jgi:hypothetical protein
VGEAREDVGSRRDRLPGRGAEQLGTKDDGLHDWLKAKEAVSLEFDEPIQDRNPADLVGCWSQAIRNVARERFVMIISHADATGVDPDRLSALEQILKLALELGFEILPGEQAMRRTEYLTWALES